MKSLLYLCGIVFLLSACTKSTNHATGGITGSVSDKTTGEPVATVNVSLSPGGQATVTGSDGTFSFGELNAEEVTVVIRKEGYLSDEGKLSIVPGRQTPAHLLIERIPAVLVTDCDTLDFGAQAGVNTLVFSIVNNGYDDLEWEIDEHCDWIAEVKPTGGIVKYGDTETVSIVIDRGKLSLLENQTVIIVRSSSKGSCSVVVKAALAIRQEGWKELAVGANKVAVQLADVAIGNRSDMENACKYSRMGSYDDWRLPTQEELTVMYENRSVIGGFCSQAGSNQSYYWSSDFYEHTGTVSGNPGFSTMRMSTIRQIPGSSVVVISRDYYYLNFTDGNIGSVTTTGKPYSARCVRTISEKENK